MLLVAWRSAGGLERTTLKVEGSGDILKQLSYAYFWGVGVVYHFQYPFGLPEEKWTPVESVIRVEEISATFPSVLNCVNSCYPIH